MRQPNSVKWPWHRSLLLHWFASKHAELLGHTLYTLIFIYKISPLLSIRAFRPCIASFHRRRNINIFGSNQLSQAKTASIPSILIWSRTLLIRHSAAILSVCPSYFTAIPPTLLRKILTLILRIASSFHRHFISIKSSLRLSSLFRPSVSAPNIAAGTAYFPSNFLFTSKLPLLTFIIAWKFFSLPPTLTFTDAYICAYMIAGVVYLFLVGQA